MSAVATREGNRLFPLPDLASAKREFERDPLYRRIPPEKAEAVLAKAWRTGAAAAEKLRAERGFAIRISDLAAENGMELVRETGDCVAAGLRSFGEYSSDPDRIVLYLGAIGKWAEANGWETDAAEEMSAAHEYFHYLEHSRLGPTSRQCVVATLRIGNFVLLQSGVRALSEIGAYGFASAWLSSRSG